MLDILKRREEEQYDFKNQVTIFHLRDVHNRTTEGLNFRSNLTFPQRGWHLPFNSITPNGNLIWTFVKKSVYISPFSFIYFPYLSTLAYRLFLISPLSLSLYTFSVFICSICSPLYICIIIPSLYISFLFFFPFILYLSIVPKLFENWPVCLFCKTLQLKYRRVNYPMRTSNYRLSNYRLLHNECIS